MAEDCVNCEDGSSVFKLPTPKVGVPVERFIIPMVRRNGQPSELYPGEKIDPCFLPEVATPDPTPEEPDPLAFAPADIPVTATGTYTFPSGSPYEGLSIPNYYTGMTATGIGYALAVDSGGAISGNFYFNSSVHPTGLYNVHLQTSVSGFVVSVNNTGANPVYTGTLAVMSGNGIINSVQVIPA